MAIVDRYTESLTVKLSSGKTLTFDADTIAFTGALSFSGNLGNTTISGTLDVTGTSTFSGSIVANGNITRASSLTVSTTGGSSDLSLTGGRDVIVSANDDVTITSTDDINLTANDALSLDSVGSMTLTSDATLTLTGSEGASQCVVTVNSSGMFLSGVQSSSHVVDFVNTTTSASGDVLRVRTLAETPDETTNYVEFASGVAQTTRGLIRGAQNSSSAAFISEGTSGDSAAYGVTPAAVEVDVQGDAVFVSGSADYGEFIEVGNFEEWGVELAEGQRYLGLPEGYIVYVRDKAFYKESPGTPMIVSYRSIVVGNERPYEDSIGQVLSFIGQVPVYVKGVVNTGDLIIPTGDFYCSAKSPSEITFKEYIKVIGTAWESSQVEDLKKVMCAVGVKNTH